MSDIPVICTIITKSHLPYARTLARSLVAHHPEIRLHVLLADEVDGHFDPTGEPFDWIWLKDLSDAETIRKMCLYYTAFELCCALRGALYEYLFAQTNAPMLLFLDADTMVYGALDTIFRQLENASILLTPHCTVPVPARHVNPHELNFLNKGLYNAGFLGLRRTDATKRFIAWLKERLEHHAFNDHLSPQDRLRSFSFVDYYRHEFVSRRLFVDQLWLNLVPLYFDGVQLCREPGMNVGHWNLFNRHLDKDALGNIQVDGRPLLLAHFSGWDMDRPDQVSKHAPMYETVPPLWKEIAVDYRRLLLQNGYENCRHYPYAFDRLDDGQKITLEDRRKYHDRLLSKPFRSTPLMHHLLVAIKSGFKR